MKNIDEMSVEELEQHINEATQKVEEKKSKEKAEKRQMVEAYAESIGTNIKELFGDDGTKSTSKKTPTRVMYIDDNGKKYGRALKEWTDSEKDPYKKNFNDSEQAK